jgi:hypothetical protein
MKKTLLLLLLVATSLCPACKKTKQANPCDGLLAETAPAQVGLIFLDKETGENILLSKNIDSSKIIITPEERLFIGRSANTDLYGALIFHIADNQKGAFKYTINIPDVGTATLTYTNVEKQTGNVCYPTAIVVTDPVIEEYSFTAAKIGTRFIITIKI